MAGNLAAYTLSDAESQKIFASEILPAEFGHAPERPDDDLKHPLAVLVVGQTGAGKTRTAPSLLSAMAALGRQPVHFIADTYKTYHPAYARLMLETPAQASPATGTDARRWLAMAANEAITRRLDVLLESACRHPDDFSQLAQAFHDGGYRVEVAVLAVPEALSRLGILTRFYEKLPEAGSRNLPIRLTPKRIHDDSYRGLLDSGAFIDSSDAVDQVVVLRRGDLVAYGDRRGSDGKFTGGGVASAIRKERERPLTKTEIKTALDDIQRLSTNDEASTQIEEVRTLLHPLIQGSGVAESPDFPALTPLKFAPNGEAPNATLCLGEV
jgi:UDP-N-acetylglucosamine kinase